MLNKDIDPNRPMFPISIVSGILKVHQRTLRIYDDEGLLVPFRSPKNRRLYSFNDIERGKFIQYLTRELGINLAGVKMIFHFLEDKQDVYETNLTPIEFVSKCAEKMGITEEQQQENREKLSRRGRKPVNDKVDNND